MLNCLKAPIHIPVVPRRPQQISLLPLRSSPSFFSVSYRPLFQQQEHSKPIFARTPLFRYFSTSRIIASESIAATTTAAPATTSALLPIPKKLSKKAIKVKSKTKVNKSDLIEPFPFTKPRPPQPQLHQQPQSVQHSIHPIDAFVAAVKKPTKSALSSKTIITTVESRDPTRLPTPKQSKVKNSKASKSAATGNIIDFSSFN